MHGVTVLGEDAQEHVAAVEEACTNSVAGSCKVWGTTAGNRTLNTIPLEAQVAWILSGTEEGIATMPAGTQGAVVTYIRCKESVTLTGIAR
jgi:hypothetical protein